MGSCVNETEIPITDRSTWEIIESDILQPSCAECHTEGTTFANQSDLVLTTGNAYDQLVNRLPSNSAAKADGLEIVGIKGLESLSNSFLWEKIDYPDFEHYYNDHSDYGELMPFGGPALTNGELEFIRKWIIEGAPEFGTVADVEELKDDSRFEIPTEEFSRLLAPASGVQLNLGPFDISSNHEREFWYYQPLNNTEDLYVNRFESNLKAGSHHMILYDYPLGDSPVENEFRDIRDDQNNFVISTAQSILNSRYVFGTQLRNTNYSFPEGVALKIQANYGLDINTHYVNRTNETQNGEVSINLHTIDFSEVEHVAENIFLNNISFNLPAGEETTITKTWTFNEERHIFLLSSHAHQFNTEWKIYISGGARDGELVYFSKDWEHPPLIEFDPPIFLSSGEGLRGEATYNNTTDRDLNFGLLSENEMMIIIGAYY